MAEGYSGYNEKLSEKKTVLVTGAAGFIGSHLCRKLLDLDHRVIAIDDFSSGSYKNLEEIQDNIQIIEHDIRTPIDIQCDEIYHLACPASPKYYQKDPIKTIETSFLGAKNTLEIAKKNKAKIFFSSTSEIYGDPKQHPQKETYLGSVNTVGPRACYDESKRLSETLFMEYSNLFGVDIRIGRIFNTYGPFMDKDDGRVISNLICQSLQDKPLTIYGDGLQTRSFCYVEDLIEAILAFMNQDECKGPMNLGNPEEISIKELAEKIIAMSCSSSEIKFHPLPKDDPQLRCPDISKAKNILGWQPKISLEQGLGKTINFYKQALVIDDVSVNSN